jgi:hypothetical protein
MVLPPDRHFTGRNRRVEGTKSRYRYCLCSALFRMLCCCFILCRQFMCRLFYFLAYSLGPCTLHTTHTHTPSLVNTNYLYSIAFTLSPHLTYTLMHTTSPLSILHLSTPFPPRAPLTSLPFTPLHPTPFFPFPSLRHDGRQGSSQGPL